MEGRKGGGKEHFLSTILQHEVENRGQRCACVCPDEGQKERKPARNRSVVRDDRGWIRDRIDRDGKPHALVFLYDILFVTTQKSWILSLNHQRQ